MHHPFTSPVDEDYPCWSGASSVANSLLGKIRPMPIRPGNHGVELPAAQFVFHRRDVNSLVFKALGMTTEEARARLVSFSMRSVTARAARRHRAGYRSPDDGAGRHRQHARRESPFETASAADLMIDAPGEVDQKQLEETASEDC